jgi:hypothetical protein
MGLAALAFFVLLSLADFFDDDTESIYASEERRNQTIPVPSYTGVTHLTHTSNWIPHSIMTRLVFTL